MKGLGANIRKVRESRGISQKEVAEALNVKSATVSSWEVDRTEPKMEHFVKMADLFNVTIDGLVNGETVSCTVDKIMDSPGAKKERLKAYMNYLIDNMETDEFEE